MASSSPRTRIRKATQADAPAITEVHFGAFGSSVISQLIFPTVSEDAKKKHTSGVLLDMTSDGEKSSETIIMVAELLPEDSTIDGQGEVVAFAKWVLRRQPVPEEEWNVEKPVTSEMLGEGSNVEMYDWFIGGLHRRCKEIVRGDAHLYLKTLASLPDQQRLGVGSALVRWGNELADSLGLESYLEASPYGYSVYRRLGFEDIDVLDFDITGTWGAMKGEGSNWGERNALQLGGPLPEGFNRAVIMRRKPGRFTDGSA